MRVGVQQSSSACRAYPQSKPVSCRHRAPACSHARLVQGFFSKTVIHDAGAVSFQAQESGRTIPTP